MAPRMNAQIDFLWLYRELGIDPGCSPEAFKHAYRRRVSELHPDRNGTGLSGEEVLKSLNLGYAAALEFFHAHGRFPGAPLASVPRPHRQAPEAPAPQMQPVPAYPQRDADPSGAPRGGRQRRWLSIVLVSLVVLVVGSQLAGGDREGDAPAAVAPPLAPARPAQVQEPHAPAAAGSLWLGMQAEEVLDVLGEPTDTARDGQLWHYGPSWIRLSCREVVDWYSSPLKPLGDSSMHPRGSREDHPLAGACQELDPATARGR